MSAHAPAPKAAPAPSIVDGLPHGLAPGLITTCVLHDDLLPDEARQDPAFREGLGSMYAQNQPGLAAKYGVVRKGHRIAPQVFRKQESAKQLSSETASGLQALEEANRVKHPQEPVAEEPPAVKEKLTEGETKELLSQLDDFDFNKFRNAVMRDLLNNEGQRKIVEARLKPLDVVDVIVRGYTTQVVPILPGKFEPEFMSHRGEDELTLKKWLVAEARGIDVDDRYFLDKYAMMGLAVSLVSINKKPLPDCHDEQGNLSESKFSEKFRIVSKFNSHLLSSLFANWFWFDMRVRKLFVAENLGNG